MCGAGRQMDEDCRHAVEKTSLRLAPAPTHHSQQSTNSLERIGLASLGHSLTAC